MCNLTSGGTTTQTNALPAWAQGSIQGGLQGALGTYANSTFNPYPSSLSATADPSLAEATGISGQHTGYQAPTVSAGSVASTNLSPYMNPYTQNVIDTTNQNINRQETQTEQANNGQAALSGAFGGDRAAIVNTESQRNANQLLAQTDAGLNQSNFSNAQQMATSDLNRGLQGQEANLQGSLAGNQQDLAAAGQEYQQGAGITQLAQNSIDRNAAQYRQGQEYPIQMAGLGTQAIAQDSGVLGDELTRQTIAPNASTLGTIAGLGTAATGIAGLLGGNAATTGGLLGLAGLGGGAAVKAAGGNGNYGGGYVSTAGAAQSTGETALVGAAGGPAYSGGSGIASNVLGGYSRGGSVTRSLGGAGRGLAGYADGGLVDDSGYVPVSSSDWMLDLGQQGQVESPYDERLGIRYGANGAMLPLPSTSAATSNGQGWSQDQSNNGGLGLEAARIGFAGGGDVGDGYIITPDGQYVQVGPTSQAMTPADYAADTTVNPMPATGAAPGMQIDPTTLSAGPGMGAGMPAGLAAASPALAGYGAIDQGMAAAAQAAQDGMSAQPGGDVGTDGGIAGGIPPAPAGQTPYQTAMPEGPDDPSLPVPPVPPADGGAAAAAPPDDRLQSSADPAAPLPGGQAQPAGLAAAPPQGPPGAGPMPQGQGSTQGNSWALPVLAAGLGMLSNAGPNAAKMIGGGLAGVQTLMQQRESALRLQQLQQQMNYQNAMIGVRQGTVGAQQTTAGARAKNADTQAAIAAARVPQLQAAAQASLAKALSLSSGPANEAQLKQSVMNDLVNNQGATMQEAYSVVSGLTIKQQNADTASGRLDQQGSQFQQQLLLRQAELAALQTNRDRQAQAAATADERKAVGALLISSTSMGKSMSYADALGQVRGTRTQFGPTPMPATPASTPATPPAANATPPGQSASPPPGVEGQMGTDKNGQRWITRGGQWQRLN